MKKSRTISDRGFPATKSPWTRIALLRGADWLAADRPEHLIIRTHFCDEPSQPVHADLLTINPFLKQAWLKKSDGTGDTFKLIVDGNMALLPAGMLHESMPAIAATTIRGICGVAAFEKEIKHLSISSDVLIAGHCGWFDESWCASPLGFRATDGRWSQFLTTGGAGGLSFERQSKAIGGMAIKAMSDVTTEVQLFAMLAEALITKFPQLSNSVVILDELDLHHAAMLVVVRKAVGPYAFKIKSAQKLDPPWKRLLEHLNGTLVVDDSSRPHLAISTLVGLFKKIDFDLLVHQINRHSQVIPHGMLK